MKSSIFLKFCIVFSLLIIALPAYAKDFRGSSIYQIFTDRFCNGDKSNDDPEVSQGMFDSTKKNWHAYWGGDLAGVRAKLSYIKKLGFDAIWISPVIDNVNKPTIDGKGVKFAPYHGYHARDFRAIDEHIGDWGEFDKLIKEAHQQGIKVMVDMPLNHTSTINHGEFGALYSGTEFMSDTENDRNKYFHHLPIITDWNDPYQLQYYTLMWLGDLNQESSYIHTYLTDAVLKLQKHGADATRLDAAKHTNWGWQHTVINKLVQNGEHFVVAEWWMSDTSDPIYDDGVKFANKIGAAMFDFPFATAVRKILGSKKDTSFKVLEKTIEQEYKDLDDCNGLVTFIDNHDMPRFLSLVNDKAKLHLALGLLFTCRGIPSFYYGTEQYLHDDTKGGGDPYTRAWMSSFDESSQGYKLVQILNKTRASSEALRYGRQTTLYVSDDSYIFKREFGREVVVVAVNKNMNSAELIESFSSHLAPGKYSDQLKQALNGTNLVVDEAHNTFKFSIPANSVSVWSMNINDVIPDIGSMIPSVATSSTSISLYGKGFGDKRGKLIIGAHVVPVKHWSDSKIVFDAPSQTHGINKLHVVSSTGKTSKSSKITIYKKKLVPITFQVKSAPLKLKGERLFITGDTPGLGEWQMTEESAAGPMLYSEDRDYILCVPMPAGEKTKLKLFILDKTGKVVRQESKFHTYKVQDEGPWRHKIEWLN